MAIAHQSTATTTFASGTTAGSRAVNLPAGVTAGDVLVVLASVADSATIATPAGWQQAVTPVSLTSYMRSYVWWRAGTGSEGATQAFVQTGSGFSLWAVSRYSGVDTAGPFAGDAVATGNGFTGPATCPAATSAADGAMVVRFAAPSGFGAPATPAGHTSRAAIVTGSFFLNVATGDTLVNSGQSTGTATYSPSEFAGSWVNRTLLLAPATAGTDYDEMGREVAVSATVVATDALSGGEQAAVEASATATVRIIAVAAPSTFRLRRPDRGSALRGQHSLRYGRAPVDLDETGAEVVAVSSVACSDGRRWAEGLSGEAVSTSAAADAVASAETAVLEVSAEVAAPEVVVLADATVTGVGSIVTVADDLVLGEAPVVEVAATVVSGGGFVRAESPEVEASAEVACFDAVGLSAEHALAAGSVELAAGSTLAGVVSLTALVASEAAAGDGRRWAEARTVDAAAGLVAGSTGAFRDRPVGTAAAVVSVAELTANAYAERPVVDAAAVVSARDGYRWAEQPQVAVTATVTLGAGRAWAEPRAVIVSSATAGRARLAGVEHGMAVSVISAVAAIVGFPFSEVGHIVEVTSTVEAGDDQGRTSIERLTVLVAGTVSGSDTPAAVEHRGVTVVSLVAGRSAREGRVRAAVHVIATVSTTGPPGALVGQRVKVLVTRRYRRVRVLTHEPQ